MYDYVQEMAKISDLISMPSDWHWLTTELYWEGILGFIGNDDQSTKSVNQCLPWAKIGKWQLLCSVLDISALSTLLNASEIILF